MGAPGVYETTTPQLPQDMEGIRSQVGGYLQSQFGVPGAQYPAQRSIQMPAQMGQAGQVMSYLLGADPFQSTWNPYPMPRTGFPGTTGAITGGTAIPWDTQGPPGGPLDPGPLGNRPEGGWREQNRTPQPWQPPPSQRRPDRREGGVRTQEAFSIMPGLNPWYGGTEGGADLDRRSREGTRQIPDALALRPTIQPTPSPGTTTPYGPEHYTTAGGKAGGSKDTSDPDYIPLDLEDQQAQYIRAQEPPGKDDAMPKWITEQVGTSEDWRTWDENKVVSTRPPRGPGTGGPGSGGGTGGTGGGGGGTGGGTGGGGGGTGGGGTGGGGGGTTGPGPGGYGGGGGYVGGYTPYQGGVPQPTIQGGYGPDIGPMPLPKIFGDTQSTLQQMMATGSPVSTEPLYNQRWNQTMQGLQRGLETLSMGNILSGKRYGMGQQRAETEATTRAFTDLGVEQTRQQTAALEAAQNRRLGATAGGTQLGTTLAGIPLDRAMAAFQTGIPAWAQAQQAAEPEYQEWLRTQPEYRPSFGAGVQYSLGYPFGSQAPTVTPNPWLQLGLGALGAAGNMFGG